MGPYAMTLVFWMLSFRPTFSLSSFTFIKRLVSSSLLSALRSGVICISEVIDISPGNLDSSLYFIQSGIHQQGFPGSAADKESACNAGDPGSIPGSGRSPGDGTGYPLQYSWASLVAQSKTRLQCGRPGFNPWVGKITWRSWEVTLQKGMATQSSILAWRIPWTEELGRLESMGLQRVGNNWVTFTFTLLSSRVTTNSLDKLLSQFWSHPLFHVWF